MENFMVRLSPGTLENVDYYVKEVRLYASRSDFVRTAVLNLIMELKGEKDVKAAMKEILESPEMEEVLASKIRRILSKMADK